MSSRSLNIKNDTGNLSIRTIQETDIDYIRLLKNDNKEFFFYKKEISQEQQRSWFNGYLERGDDYMFIVEVDGKPIGCMGIRMIDRAWDVYNVILGSVAHQKQGYMSRAFKDMLQFAYSEKDAAVTLMVLKHNPAVGWYAKNGFAIMREESDHYYMVHQR